MALAMRRNVRKNITLPAALDARLRQLAKRRHASQSGLIVHLVAVGLRWNRLTATPS
jgi:hypothetical protein